MTIELINKTMYIILNKLDNNRTKRRDAECGVRKESICIWLLQGKMFL